MVFPRGGCGKQGARITAVYLCPTFGTCAGCEAHAGVCKLLCSLRSWHRVPGRDAGQRHPDARLSLVPHFSPSSSIPFWSRYPSAISLAWASVEQLRGRTAWQRAAKRLSFYVSLPLFSICLSFSFSGFPVSGESHLTVCEAPSSKVTLCNASPLLTQHVPILLP